MLLPTHCCISTDRDECDEGTHECNEYNSNCTNTVGSYNCTCHEGFQFDSDGRTCVELEMTGSYYNDKLDSFEHLMK